MRSRSHLSQIEPGPTPEVGAPPLLSVVIPAFNAEQHLAECLDSVLRQSLRATEVIVVDDGSTDGTAELVRQTAQEDSRVRLVHQEHAGPGVARNRGLALATGTYLTFVDADDRVLPGAYRSLVATLDRTGSDLATGGYVRFGASGTSRPNLVERVHGRDLRRTTLADSPALLEEPVLWNKVFRRSFWDACVGEVPSSVNYEDQEPTYRALLGARSIDVLERDVYGWRLSDGRGTRSAAKARRSDVAARLAVIRSLEGLLVDVPEQIRATAYAIWLGTDLAMHLEHVPTTRRRFWRLLRDGAAEIAGRAPEGAWGLIPAQNRLLAWVAASGSRRDVEEILGTRAEDTTALPWESHEGGWRVAPSYLPRLRTPVPTDLLRVEPCDVSVAAGIRSMEWQDPNTLVLTGFAYLRGPDPTGRRIRVVASDGVEDLVTVPARLAVDPMIDEESSDPWRQYGACGFSARLVLADRASSTSMRLDVEVELSGLTARTPLQDRQRHAAVGPAGQNPRWIARTSRRDRVVLELVDAPMSDIVVTRVDTTGDSVVVEALSGSQPEGVMAAIREHERVAFARLPAPPGYVRYTGALPKLPEAFRDGGEADLEGRDRVLFGSACRAMFPSPGPRTAPRSDPSRVGQAGRAPHHATLGASKHQRSADRRGRPGPRRTG